MRELSSKELDLVSGAGYSHSSTNVFVVTKVAVAKTNQYAEAVALGSGFKGGNAIAIAANGAITTAIA